MNYRIPFNRPVLVGQELTYVADSVRRGKISGDGAYTAKCEQLLEALIGAPKVMLTTSCTHALELAALLLNIQPGDEFILPTFTFPSVANAFVLRGGVPVFLDIRTDTLNLDEGLLEERITSRTRAIAVMHYGGIACEMDAIMSIAQRHAIPVVEDNAHGLLGKYRGKSLGSFGSFAGQSFHETKNFSCGEGGALVINDVSKIARAEILREKGTDRTMLLRGLVDKYTWIDVGSSYLPSDLLSAFLLAQLEERVLIQTLRKRIWDRYAEELADWAKRNGIQLPIVPPDCDPPFHLFYILLPSESVRTALINHLRAKGIAAVFHYLPLHSSKMGASFGGGRGDCPVAESVSERLLRLPFFNDLTAENQSEVIEAICDFSP